MNPTAKAMLSWERQDIERKFMFPAGKHTNVNPLFSLLIGLILGVAAYGILFAFPGSYLATIWMQRGLIPYFIAAFFFWGLAILLLKRRKLALQKQALAVRVTPLDYEYVLTPTSVDQVLEMLYKQVEDPERFVLFSRILRALSNLKNLGRVSDVEVIIRSQSEGDQNILDTSYGVLRGLLWAMPVLGFIGTAVGLSAAIGAFGSTLSEMSSLEPLRASLKDVVAGLGVAFDTTLEGLVCTLILQLLLTFTRKQEDEFLLECDDYCHRWIIGRLKLVDQEAGA
ncbi:MAG: MotA/TolQ/ExbB proton channel family protein [Planctomycetota bacterium]|nr:MotA/TolQ/ExbB proton channel family protein [Planctomycetota bacterium]